MGMKVLICDDAKVIRRLHTNLLIEKGFKEKDIYHAENGLAALKLVKEVDIDLFIIDWNMPDLNGLHLTKTLRLIERYQNTPIIMVTAEAGKYNVIEAIKAGVTDYMIKPIKSRILWEKVNPFLDIRR